MVEFAKVVATVQNQNQKKQVCVLVQKDKMSGPSDLLQMSKVSVFG
jgi:hypothetical protein